MSEKNTDTMNKNKIQPVTYKPFASGQQHVDWTDKNCGSCKKGFDRKAMRFRCDWERKLCVAAIGGKQVTEKVAKEIGMLDNEGCDLWECPGWARR